MPTLIFGIGPILDRLDRIVVLLTQIRDDAAIGILTANHQETRIMATLDDLTSAVTANGEIEASAVALIQGLADKLDNIDPGDPAAVAALATELRSQSDALAAAVAANTPADPGTGDGSGGNPPVDPGTGGNPVDPGTGAGEGGPVVQPSA